MNPRYHTLLRVALYGGLAAGAVYGGARALSALRGSRLGQLPVEVRQAQRDRERCGPRPGESGTIPLPGGSIPWGGTVGTCVPNATPGGGAMWFVSDEEEAQLYNDLEFCGAPPVGARINGADLSAGYPGLGLNRDLMVAARYELAKSGRSPSVTWCDGRPIDCSRQHTTVEGRQFPAGSWQIPRTAPDCVSDRDWCGTPPSNFLGLRRRGVQCTRSGPMSGYWEIPD